MTQNMVPDQFDSEKLAKGLKTAGVVTSGIGLVKTIVAAVVFVFVGIILMVTANKWLGVALILLAVVMVVLQVFKLKKYARM
ncbi:MAG TPA: hypothetical protein PLY40_04025 [Bacillota bacterium]|nr:hypothetical protein [Bacillota bacterium]